MTPTKASSRITLRTLRGWPLFITLSLLIHLLALLLWYMLAPARITVSEAPVAPFAVQLESAAPPAPPAPARQPRASPPVMQKSSEPPQKPRTEPAPSTSSAEKPIAPPQQPPAAVAPERFDERELGTSRRLFESFPGVGSPVPPAPGPAPAEEEPQPNDESRLHIESLIRTRFAEHFQYPAMAQSQGWEGEVVLAFRIGPEGNIHHIQIVHSSGHTILDQAALGSLRRIERIEFAPGVMLHQVLELRMPVIYHLAQR